MRKPVLALTLSFFLLPTLLLVGCTEIQQLGQGEQEPTFVPFILPTPTPLASAVASSPTPSIKATPSANATAALQCTNPGECLGEKPKYCENGVIVNNCGKCGCPKGAQCCRTTTEYGFYCAVPSLCIENWTGMGPGGTLEVATPTSTPTPSPLPAPCKTAAELNASTPNLTAMLSIVASAYKKVFNKTISWTQADAQTFLFTDNGGNYQTDLWFYVSKYRGWQQLDVLKEITNSTMKCWREIAVDKENSPQQETHYYWFRMPCFNWTYLIDARITERADTGKWAQNYSKRFAQNLMPSCPE